MYWASLHLFLGMLNSIFNALAVKDWTEDVFFNSRCVNLNFEYSCSVTVNVKRLPCHSACVKQKFAQSSRLKLDEFLLQSCYRCLKLNVVPACNFTTDIFSLRCFSRCFKLYFANRSSVRLNLFLLSCHSGCLNHS